MEEECKKIKKLKIDIQKKRNQYQSLAILVQMTNGTRNQEIQKDLESLRASVLELQKLVMDSQSNQLQTIEKTVVQVIVVGRLNFGETSGGGHHDRASTSSPGNVCGNGRDSQQYQFPTPSARIDFLKFWVVVDRLSKYGHFIAIAHPYSAAKIAGPFMEHIFRLHGMPHVIVNDRDTVFVSTFWQELFSLQGVSLNMSSAYHPQSDGQTEVVNKAVENYLQCMCNNMPSQWVKWLPLAEYWYNTKFHTSIQTTPFEVLYGQLPPIYPPYFLGDSKVEAVDRSLTACENALSFGCFSFK